MSIFTIVGLITQLLIIDVTMDQSAKAATLTMMYYLADEVRDNNVAVNILIPGNARTTGYDEQNDARRDAGQGGNRPGRISMLPEHIVPITVFLAEHPHTGKAEKNSSPTHPEFRSNLGTCERDQSNVHRIQTACFPRTVLKGSKQEVLARVRVCE